MHTFIINFEESMYILWLDNLSLANPLILYVAHVKSSENSAKYLIYSSKPIAMIFYVQITI